MNALRPFSFDNHVAHGAVVQLAGGIDELLDRRTYGADVRRLLGETLAAMPLLATHLNFRGRINLQFQGEKPHPARLAREGARAKRGIDLLVAQVDQDLHLRAMAKAAPEVAGGFTELLHDGLLALMLEPENAPGAEPRPAHQALVPIEGARLSDALEGYFARSEQLPTLMRLAGGGGKVAGFLLQRLPLEGLRDADAQWTHLRTLAATLKPEELLEAEADTILRRLFHAEALRVFAPRPVTVACRCSRAGISRLLLSLGREEIEAILKEQGKVDVTCEFCGRQYTFTPHEAAELLIASGSAPVSGTTH